MKKKTKKYYQSKFISYPTNEEVISTTFQMFADYLKLKFAIEYTRSRHKDYTETDGVLITLEEEINNVT